MHSIKLRLLFLLLIGLSCILSFSYITALSHINYASLSQSILDSSYLVDLTNNLHREQFQKSDLHTMKKFRSRLQPKERMVAMSNVIQSYADRNHVLLKKRVKAFTEIEKRYTQNLRKQIIFFKQRTQIYGLASLGAMMLLIILVFIYIQIVVFKPIRGLFHKMIEFLNNRYTYQFTSPPPDEIGKLHATFNAMAQRVISNFEDLKSLDAANLIS